MSTFSSFGRSRLIKSIDIHEYFTINKAITYMSTPFVVVEVRGRKAQLDSGIAEVEINEIPP